MSHPLYQQPETPQAEEAPRPQGIRVHLPGVIERPYVTYALVAINVAISPARFL
jgi:hypothetical protein